MPNTPDEPTVSAKATSPVAAGTPATVAPTEFDESQLASVVGGVQRRGGDDDLDDLEVER